MAFSTLSPVTSTHESRALAGWGTLYRVRRFNDLDERRRSAVLRKLATIARMQERAWEELADNPYSIAQRDRWYRLNTVETVLHDFIMDYPTRGYDHALLTLIAESRAKALVEDLSRLRSLPKRAEHHPLDW